MIKALLRKLIYLRNKKSLTGNFNTCSAVQSSYKFNVYLPHLQIGAVIVTPTRELALQIDEVLSQFLSHLPDFSHMLLIGGNNPMLDVEKMQEHGYAVDTFLKVCNFPNIPVAIIIAWRITEF